MLKCPRKYTPRMRNSVAYWVAPDENWKSTIASPENSCESVGTPVLIVVAATYTVPALASAAGTVVVLPSSLANSICSTVSKALEQGEHRTPYLEAGVESQVRVAGRGALDVDGHLTAGNRVGGDELELGEHLDGQGRVRRRARRDELGCEKCEWADGGV